MVPPSMNEGPKMASSDNSARDVVVLHTCQRRAHSDDIDVFS